VHVAAGRRGSPFCQGRTVGGQGRGSMADPRGSGRSSVVSWASAWTQA